MTFFNSPVTEKLTLYRVLLRDQWTGQSYPGTGRYTQEYAVRLVAAMSATSHRPQAVWILEPVPEHEGSSAGAQPEQRP